MYIILMPVASLPNTAACLYGPPFDWVDLLSNTKVQRNGQVYPGFAQFILSLPLYVALDQVKNPYALGPETTATKPFLARCVADPGMHNTVLWRI